MVADFTLSVLIPRHQHLVIKVHSMICNNGASLDHYSWWFLLLLSALRSHNQLTFQWLSHHESALMKNNQYLMLSYPLWLLLVDVSGNQQMKRFGSKAKTKKIKHQMSTSVEHSNTRDVDIRNTKKSFYSITVVDILRREKNFKITTRFQHLVQLEKIVSLTD